MQKFRKCKCENIDYGTYENQVLLKIPLGLDIRYNDPEKMLRTSVSVDACLAKEIQFLWSEGIKTTGCCCNHNKETHHPFIGVTHDCIEKMKSFGYINAPNHLDNTREDGCKIIDGMIKSDFLDFFKCTPCGDKALIHFTDFRY